MAVVLKEWALELSRTRVSPGPVVLRLSNTGTLHHSLAVEGNGIQELSNHVAPGDSGTLVVDLAPGRYRVYCPVKESGDHDALGMSAELLVQ